MECSVMKQEGALKRLECKELLAGLLLIEDVRYFVYTAASGARWLVPADCPHRGGPLNFGTVEPDRHVVRCPWHKMLCSERTLINRSVPAVRVCAQWSAILPEKTGLGGD